MNGKIYYIQLYGDEHNKRAETEDGYTIIQNESHQWCYARMNRDSTLSATQWLLGDDIVTKPDLKQFLDSTPKHLSIFSQEKNDKKFTQYKTKAAIGLRRVLIILMGYQDLPFTKSKMDYEKLFNEEGYSDDHAQGSVRDFYLSASYNQLELESDIYGPYMASNNMSYYGKNSGRDNQDANAYSLFEEAITHVSQETDLSQYDGDGDGFIDNVHIIFAGYGEEAGAASDAIWSHEATFYRPYEIQGLKIDRYSCAPELRGNSGGGISRIGPHCHEIGHALGAMDYYDTDYATNGEYLGTGKWDVMAGGSWNNDGITPADFNPYVKAYNFGWIEPKPLPAGEVAISPSYLDPDNYYLLKSSEYGDFYLLENRSKEKWGGGIPGEGLLFFHIHSDIVNAGNDINSTTPQKCYVVCASSRSKTPNKTPSSYGEINSDGCPYPGKSNNSDFGQSSTPMAFYWDDETCGIEINNISLSNDGIITLSNNSEGASYKPMTMRSLAFEGFENEEAMVIPIKEGSLWNIEDNPENTMTIIDKPIAYEGVKCLQLSAMKTKVDTTDSLEFTCTPVDSGKMRIKIHVASLHLRFNKPNIIRVGYRTDYNPDWKYTEIQSSENNHWIQSFVDLPDNVVPHFKIIGFVYGGSVLAIDNIEVEQEIVQDISDVNVIKYNGNQYGKFGYYSLNGIIQKVPPKGIAIWRMEDGNLKKVIIK